MNDSDWEKAKEIFAAARKLTPELRLPYLEEVCAGDAEIFREVESLLASYDESEDFMESSAIGEVADAIHQTNKIGKGVIFGHYEIIEQIGAGGAGEVYLAEDKILKRPVAVKILNAQFARHESNLERFIWEARTASALNHPNILIIHEIGGGDENVHYIVTEFIKGKTLRRILNEKSLTIREVLDISIQIAGALRAAHEANLVHRDIKPENIMVRHDSIVKILDFGLAKLIEQNPTGFESESYKQNQTAKGVIMGTINYMSPEQARGETIDFRSDIFSFGIVLYEMLTKQHPFRGETVNHTIIAILEKEPPPLPDSINYFSAGIETVIKKCLAKNVAERYDSAKDLLADLKAVEKKSGFETEIERSSIANNATNAETRNAEAETTAEVGNSIPNNLSETLYPIIGRENEISALKKLLRQTSVRLVTLTGIGGVGKTRLAKAAADDLLHDFPDGVFFIELAAITDPELVASAIAQPLGIQETGGKPLSEILKAYLGDKKILLVLDNFEQVIDAAPQIGELLAASRLKILVTSRALLRLSAEAEFIVPPLAVPLEIGEISPEKLADFEAIKLFVQRARKAKPVFNLNEENAESVAAICARLDGLPLAIELAAARVKILAPQAILSKLENRLPLLTGGARDLPERQQTMRGAIEWSYSLLNEDEKKLFCRLAVFAGGFTFEAAEIVGGGDQSTAGQIDFLDLLTALADKSLLTMKEQSESGETRFRMLEIVREYALELLETSGQASEGRRAHSLYFLELAEKAESYLQAVQEGEWLNRLAEEHDNLRAALNWSFEFETEIAARLAGSLRLFWNFHGHLAEGRQWFEKILQCHCEISPNTRWKILYGAGILANLQGDYHFGRSFLEQSRKAAALTGDRRLVAVSNNILTMVLCELENYGEAKSLAEESLAIGRELNDKNAIARSLLTLGEVARSEDNYGAARRFYEESLEIFQELNMKNGLVGSLLNLGMVAYYQNDLGTSRIYYEKALQISRELKLKMMTFFCLDGFAALALKNEQLEQAARLSGAARTLGESINLVPEKEDRRFRDAYLTELKNKMNETDFSEFYEQGKNLKLEQAIALISSSKP